MKLNQKGFGNTPVNKEKCYVGFLRLKIRAESNEMRTKSDRYNPSALERWGGLQKSAYRKEGPENSQTSRAEDND